MICLLRDPQIGSGVYLSVASGQSNNILTRKNPEVSKIGKYLSLLIQHNVTTGFLLPPTLQAFTHDYYIVGKDPTLPIIEQKKDDIKLNGVAVFKEDRMVMKVDQDKLFYLKLMSAPVKSGNVELALSEAVITLDHRKVNNLNVVIAPFNLYEGLKASVLDMSEQLSLTEPAVSNRLSLIIEQKIENEMMVLIQRLQEETVDPIGFGSKYRAFVRGKTFLMRYGEINILRQALR
ncbi:Ger(x)C family spore germination C-terminal domain-containing protein [Paenibacillus sp. R14(2021)]|uniref:Ger(x)C family spore germination C-terminal domain-containing protein n=1 Tax=Paenibacillus sp. R14(2021) TaxID=2859228 RepID=UPI001C612882|nr:Ger(x)C family spore germination C-terminal domain-containing protein [Paenibacillus sp. R14(2021)]